MNIFTAMRQLMTPCTVLSLEKEAFESTDDDAELTSCTWE